MLCVTLHSFFTNTLEPTNVGGKSQNFLARVCPFVGFRLSLKLLLQHPQQTGGSRTMFGSLPLQTGSCDFHHLSEQVLFFGSFNVITRVRRPHIGRYLSLQDGMNTHSISEELPRVPKVSNTLTVSSLELIVYKN